MSLDDHCEAAFMRLLARRKLGIADYHVLTCVGDGGDCASAANVICQTRRYALQGYFQHEFLAVRKSRAEYQNAFVTLLDRNLIQVVDRRALILIRQHLTVMPAYGPISQVPEIGEITVTRKGARLLAKSQKRF